MMEANDKLLNSKQVLDLFDGHLSYRTLLNLVREKKLKALKVGGKLVFSERYVLQWRDRQLGVA
ncbi:MAG: helix-turn-helix domain-containing protein [Phascolarctobacterium sp.]|nr:helix-turn-helix domain-containing protein [Phascolarctobacterium sp.]